MDKIPGIETADYEVAEVDHNGEALTELFRGAKVVSNMVGPFSKYGPSPWGGLRSPPAATTPTRPASRTGC